MNQPTQKILDRIDHKLEKMISDLEQRPTEALNQAPYPGAWSPLQVLYHLVLAEKLSLGYIKKKLSYNPELPKADWRARLRTSVLNAYLKSPLKQKAPANVNESNFPDDLSLEQITKDWRAMRQELRSYLEGLEPELFSRQVYKHPLSGRMSLAGMLSFFENHFDRHHKQIQRALAK
jgi:uncharacterized damage-inducible protein DinB